MTKIIILDTERPLEEVHIFKILKNEENNKVLNKILINILFGLDAEEAKNIFYLELETKLKNNQLKDYLILEVENFINEILYKLIINQFQPLELNINKIESYGNTLIFRVDE